MPGPIVCGVDDSAGSRDAVATSLAIAARAKLPLVFVHVAPDESRLSRSDPERKRRLGQAVSAGIELLERLIAPVATGRGATTRVALGDPAEQLAAVAASTRAEMIVVGSRGRTSVKAALLGSVSRGVVALSDRTVLVVPPGAAVPEEHPTRGRSPTASVLCGIDASPESVGAAVVASRLAARMGDRLVLALAHPPLRPSLPARSDKAAAWLQWSGAPALLAAAADVLAPLGGPHPVLTLEPGNPREALLRAARRESAELLALTSPVSRPVLRSGVVGILIASAPAPVLLVPDQAARRARDQARLLERAAA